MESRGLTFMVMPVAVFSRSAEPFPGRPWATMPASSEVRATDLMPFFLSRNARMREEKRSPWEVRPSL